MLYVLAKKAYGVCGSCVSMAMSARISISVMAASPHNGALVAILCQRRHDGVMALALYGNILWQRNDLWYLVWRRIAAACQAGAPRLSSDSMHVCAYGGIKVTGVMA